jgi:hypothetical protein
MVSPDAVGELSASIREIADKFPRQAGRALFGCNLSGTVTSENRSICAVMLFRSAQERKTRQRTGGGRGGFSFREERLSEVI